MEETEGESLSVATQDLKLSIIIHKSVYYKLVYSSYIFPDSKIIPEGLSSADPSAHVKSFLYFFLFPLSFPSTFVMVVVGLRLLNVIQVY